MVVDVQLQELHRCARDGDVARVREFASCALINRQDLSLGFTALHFAAREGSPTPFSVTSKPQPSSRSDHSGSPAEHLAEYRQRQLLMQKQRE